MDLSNLLTTAPPSSSEPPRKRPRQESSGSTLPPRPPPSSIPSRLSPQNQPPTKQQQQLSRAPIASLPIHPPAHYTHPSSAPTPFQLPLHLTSFSYSPTRELLLDDARKDEALAVYTEPALGVDLNEGFEECTWREGTEDEGLDALLDTLDNYAMKDNTGAATDLLSKISVITWRGMMTKLLLAVYETEGSSRGRADGWEMNGMVLDGTLYLEDANSPTKLANKAASESSYKLQSYYGYSFEAFSTSPPSSTSSPTFSPPNTNVQWCSIVKTNLGGFRTILGGEVDCVLPTANIKRIKADDFVELKTNIIISSPRDEMMFERHKLLKHYTQSFLLGVPLVTVGFRTREGQLTALQNFKTLEIPRLVRGKPHAWDPLACLSSARSLLSFIHSTIARQPSTVTHQSLFSSPPSPSEDEALSAWPVFRISFIPSGPNAGVSIREIGENEMREEVLGGKRVEERVGILLEKWTTGVRERRRKMEEKRLANAEVRLIGIGANGRGGLQR